MEARIVRWYGLELGGESQIRGSRGGTSSSTFFFYLLIIFVRYSVRKMRFYTFCKFYCTSV